MVYRLLLILSIPHYVQLISSLNHMYAQYSIYPLTHCIKYKHSTYQDRRISRKAGQATFTPFCGDSAISPKNIFSILNGLSFFDEISFYQQDRRILCKAKSRFNRTTTEFIPILSGPSIRFSIFWAVNIGIVTPPHKVFFLNFQSIFIKKIE
jgi:hypothetical protein